MAARPADAELGLEPALAAMSDMLGPVGFSTDPADLAPHLTDWRGQKTGAAHALARPVTAGEVQALVRMAGAAGLCLVPQGGNTGLVGGSVPEPEPARPTILVSMRRMAGVRSLDARGLTMTVGAGTILEHAHAAAAEAGCAFPLSLGAKGSATIGGLVSTNAGGTQVLRHGPMRSLVLGLEAVLPDGSLLDQLAPLRKDNTGYDLKQLLIGAEGTLGIVTAASLRLVPAPAVTAAAWVGVSGFAAALELLARLRAEFGETIESFECMGDEGLALLASMLGYRAPLAGRHQVHVLVELAAADAGAPLDARLADVLQAALEAGMIGDAAIAASLTQRADFWRLREELPEAERREGPSLKNDVAVPVDRVPTLHAEGVGAFARAFPGARPLVFGHLGDGNLHFNLRPPAGEGRDWLVRHGEPARRLLHDLVTGLGGSISAEHGIGTVKAAELARTGDPAKLRAMRAIKDALDPQNIMNPGKVLP
jgi:FAD/FMN-containing dehydrogenase